MVNKLTKSKNSANGQKNNIDVIQQAKESGKLQKENKEINDHVSRSNFLPDHLRRVRHAFVSGDPDLSPLLLLHGTGGDEHELLEVGEFLTGENPTLSIRGRILENGQFTRYFERYEEGKFNLDSLHEETKWLIETVNELSLYYGLNTSEMIAIGFSNGANIAAHALMSQEDVPFKSVLAFHPMLVEKIKNPVKRSDAKVFMTYGELDPIISRESFDQLEDQMKKTNASISTFRLKSSHVLSQEELQAAQQWLRGNRLGANENQFLFDEHDHHHEHEMHHHH